MVERGGFEPPVPLRLTWPEFGPSSGTIMRKIRASVLERICSPGVVLGSAAGESVSGLAARLGVTQTTVSLWRRRHRRAAVRPAWRSRDGRKKVGRRQYLWPPRWPTRVASVSGNLTALPEHMLMAKRV